jgi:hypothetical protein
MSPLFAQFWAGSRSFHVFLHWQPSAPVLHVH